MDNWITRLFAGSRGGTRRVSSSRLATRRTSRPTKAAGPHVNRSYLAVTINVPASCCDAASNIKSTTFLAAHAPQLPLDGCTQPAQCRCRYQHLKDRRQDMRRDEDHGLPSRLFGDDERRYHKDRRLQIQAG